MAGARLVGLLRYVRALTGTAGAGDRSDGDLLGQFVARRDEGAFAALLGRHGALVLGVCRQVLGDEQDAEDAFQATFLVLARKAGTIRQQDSLAAWLHRVAVNLCRTTLEATARRRTHERQVALMAQAIPAQDEAPRDWQPLVHEEVDRLPQKYRLPVVLCYLEGKTHEETARLSGPPALVRGFRPPSRRLPTIRRPRPLAVLRFPLRHSTGGLQPRSPVGRGLLLYPCHPRPVNLTER
jgi:RNA polymerase sigma-70 factor (ECF subfamily)